MASVANLPSARVRWLTWATFAAFVIAGGARGLPDPPVAAVAGVVAALAAAALVNTAGPLMLGWAALATAAITVLGTGVSSNIGWFAAFVPVSWCVLVGGARVGIAYSVALLAVFGAQPIWASHDPGWGELAAGTCLTLGAALLVLRERDLVARLHAAQAGLAERARAEERNRIARELHDMIAHSLTVALLHVSSARMALQHEPDRAADALAEAERLGRESLTEVRSAVGLLRPSGETAPLPDVSALPSLADRYRAAGADVTLTVDAADLPATTGLAVYRIVQEALTNAARHAPGAAVAVDVHQSERGVQVTVDSAGHPGRGAGLGLIGMRERAESVGGTCEAGPGGHGWLVRANLPVQARATT